MRVLPPVAVTAAMLNSAIAEPDTTVGEAAWASGATYAKGDRVVSASTHLLYESVQGSNTNHAVSDSAWWIVVGATNRWRMFDYLRRGVTTQANEVKATITPGQRIDAVYAEGCACDTFRVRVLVGGVEKVSRTVAMTGRLTTTWKQYFFGRFRDKSKVIIRDLPQYSGADIEVTATRTGGTAKVGSLVVGQFVFVGDTRFDPEISVVNYSKLDRNFAGTLEQPIQRRNVPTLSGEIIVNEFNVNMVMAVRDDLNAVPAVWSGLDDADSGLFEAMTIFGIIRQADLTFAAGLQLLATKVEGI